MIKLRAMFQATENSVCVCVCVCVVRAGNDEELKKGLSCTAFTFQTITNHFRREALLVNDFSGETKERRKKPR